MNGVYDFEMYKTPYLDMEMLMEKKAQKRKKRLLILSGIATILMAIIAVMLLYMISLVSKTGCMIACTLLCIYIVVGILMIGRFVKKGEYLWQ